MRPPLIKNRIVDINGYISLAEFMDIIAIAESTPGPIAISGDFCGRKNGGHFGRTDKHHWLCVAFFDNCFNIKLIIRQI